MVNYRVMLQEQFDQMALILIDESLLIAVIGHDMRARFFETQCTCI